MIVKEYKPSDSTLFRIVVTINVPLIKKMWDIIVLAGKIHYGAFKRIF
jgi:hypothetical protein